jgi:hypothetical protein
MFDVERELRVKAGSSHRTKQSRCSQDRFGSMSAMAIAAGVLCVFLAWCAAAATLTDSASSDYCPLVPRQPGDRRADPSRLRVLALNAEYLMRECKESLHGCPWTSAAAARHHLEMIASALAAADADIISLSEVRYQNSVYDTASIENVIDALCISEHAARVITAACARRGNDLDANANNSTRAHCRCARALS